MSKRADDLSLFEHVEELRARLFKSVVAIILATCVVYSFIDPILEFVIRPVGRLIFTSVADAFVARIILSLLGGVLVSLPYILFHIWQFVSAGLKNLGIVSPPMMKGGTTNHRGLHLNEQPGWQPIGKTRLEQSENQELVKNPVHDLS